MNRVKLVTVIIAMAMLGFGKPSLAGHMRCGVHLIEDGKRRGPGKYEVLKKCGEPRERHGNTWVYKSGGSKKVLRFNDAGQLQRIDG